MVTYTRCPVCRAEKIQYKLSAKDYTVSQKLFEIVECGDCSLRFTQQVPEEQAIGEYYQAEDYISHTDTKEGLINRIYHLVRTITLKSKAALIKKHTGIKKGSLLDIGAGTGAFLATMRHEGWQVKGIEPDASARQRALALYSLELENMNSLTTFEERSFDAITLWHVLEHVHDLHNYIDQIKRLLKPGGKIFIAVPNYTSYDAGVYQSYWAAYDVPRHLYHFSPASIKSLLQQHQLKPDAILPMWFDSIYISMLSEKYKTGRNNTLKAIFNGFISNMKAIFNNEKCSSITYVISSNNNK